MLIAFFPTELVFDYGETMRLFFILLLSALTVGVFDKPAEAGLFFRGPGPIRRLFFGGPIRRRMFARRMMRRPCFGCMPRNFRGPRCGRGIHGGCGGGPNQFNRNFRNFNDPFSRRSDFDAVFNPGVPSGGPFSRNASSFGVGRFGAKPEPVANPNDPCGIQFGQQPGGAARVSEGFYFDRRTNTCEYGAREFGNNPFPFRSEAACENAVRNGACSIGSNFELNQRVFFR